MSPELHLGDCIELLAAVDEASVDLVFADLPYGVTANAWDKRIDLARLWPALLRVCKPTTPLVFTAQQPFTSLLVLSQPKLFRFSMVWKKDKVRGHLNAKKQPLRTHEDLLIFYRKQPPYHPETTKGHAPIHSVYSHKKNSNNYGATRGGTVTSGGRTERLPTSVLPIGVVNLAAEDHMHSTQKPLGLAGWFIDAYTSPGDLVVDPTAGSASTLVAAHRRGRRALGFEMDPDMFAKATERLRRVDDPSYAAPKAKRIVRGARDGWTTASLWDVVPPVIAPGEGDE